MVFGLGVPETILIVLLVGGAILFFGEKPLMSWLNAGKRFIAEAKKPLPDENETKKTKKKK